MNIFTDFHHSSLLRSLVLLFEKRLGYRVYRPIGMDWYHEGYWAINSLEDTAKQFLLEDHQDIKDGTAPLNRTSIQDVGIYRVSDPGNVSYHKAITFEAFKKFKFEFVIASIPQHVPLFEKLIRLYQPDAKLIVQIGNNWSFEHLKDKNILASVKEDKSVQGSNICYYHQEFDLDIFKAQWLKKTGRISSYINVLQNMKQGWKDFTDLESALKEYDIEMFSYGGQCRDGNKVGPVELSQSMLQDEMIFHVKDGGDGFGHIIYNAYACGRPVITRKSFYKGKLAEELMNDQNTIDLDEISIEDAVDLIKSIREDEDRMIEIGKSAFSSFYTNVNYKEEAEKIYSWLNNIKERS